MSAGSSLPAWERLLHACADASADQQRALVSEFVHCFPVSPLVSADEAVIWYHGTASDVVLRGDMLQERSESLTRLGRTELWWHRARYEPDARLDYHLLVDGVDLGDPRNPRRVPSGYGPRAELRMPGYVEPRLGQRRADVPRGVLHTFEGVSSVAYPSTRTVWVYMPPNYDPTRRYSSVYFHDGGDYIRFAGTPVLLDTLIADGVIAPCVAVFVDPSVEHGRVADYDLNPRYVRLIADELVPWVAGRFAVAPERERRAVVGASFGGLISLLIGWERSDLFGGVVSQSGFVGRRNAAILERCPQPPTPPQRVHLIVGSYETHIGPFERDSREANFLEANRALHAVLQSQRVPVSYAEYHEGHSWGLWRARLGAALVFVLPPAS